MSSALEKYVTEFMISKDDSSDLAKESAENIVSLINDENQQKDVKTSLLNLIQCLGQYLVHEDDTIRAKSTGLLSNTIDKCDQSQLTEQSVGVLVNFYSSRLSDQASVPNLMTGLVALTSKFDHFYSNCTNAVLNGLIKEVRVQAYPHITRNATFKVFENLLDFHCADLEPVNDIFIRAVTNSMTGEKDPRNLMIVYTIIQKIVRSLDIANQVEELFEATFCYFPITFRPPPDNPYGITAKDLKSNLRKCFASTPLFAKLGLPLLIQKMTTTSGSAKKDALQTITACAPVYDASELRRVGIKLYDAVKVEIISQSPDPSLREYSLDAIHALTKAMTINAADPLKDEETTNILKSLVDDCALLLEELEEDNVKPASLVLRAAASASLFAYSYIETRIVPMVLRQYREHDDMADRYLILCTLVAIIQARKIVFGATTNVDENVDTSHDSVLVSYKDRLTEIFSSALKASNEHPQIRLMGVLGLGLLCALKGYMSRSERGINIQSLNTVLETEEEEKLRMPLEVSLIEISNFDPELITHLTIPALMKLLPDFSSSTEITDITNPVSYKLTLKTIEKLSAPPTIYQVTEKKLLEKFFLICGHNEDRKYATEVIRTLLNIIEAKDVAKHRDLKGGTSNLLPQLISAVIASYSESDSNDAKAVITSNEVMQVVYLIFQNIIKNMSSEEQQTYIVDMFKLFKENDLSTINVSGNAKFDPNSVNASDATAACTQMFSTIVCSLRKEVKIPMESNESFLNDVVERAVNNSHQPQVTSLARIVASVINKWKEGDSLQAYLSVLIPRLEALIEAKSLAALTLYIWVAKALITRSHKLGLQMTENIIKLIPDSVIGKQAACGFDILLGDDPLCLNKQCFANVSLLHKQKFMAAILPKLLNEFHQAHDEDRKLNYLIGIAYLLKNVPKAILIDELPPLVPLLIDSLSFADTDLKLSTLDLFAFSLSEATHVMAKNIKELLPAFISLIGPTEKSMQVRIAALKCIDLVSVKVSRDIVLPYTKETLKAIAVPLDDKKRLVRKQAVECRESWYLIGQKK